MSRSRQIKDGDQLVYRGRDAVGAISPSKTGFVALNMSGSLLGDFKDAKDAFSAVLNATAEKAAAPQGAAP